MILASFSSLNSTLTEIFWSDLTFKQQSSWIYHSAGTPVLLLSTLVYSKVALECLQNGKSGNLIALMSNLTKKFLSVNATQNSYKLKEIHVR